MGFPANEMLRGGEQNACCSNCFYPFKQTYFVCYQLSFHTHRDCVHQAQMIPEGGEPSTSPALEKDDGVAAGYRECAMEALNWLLNLGYSPGHPLIRSLAAHLTKKQAYLEKINLERFLIDETFKTSMEEFDDENDVDPEIINSRYKICTYQIENDKEIQKALVNAAYKGCNLQYSDGLP